MTNKFSVDIHTYLTEKIEWVEAQKEEAKKCNNSPDEQYCAGQLQELQAVRKYLTSKFDLNTQTYY